VAITAGSLVSDFEVRVRRMPDEALLQLGKRLRAATCGSCSQLVYVQLRVCRQEFRRRQQEHRNRPEPRRG
jgi:hypothetical protein